MLQMLRTATTKLAAAAHVADIRPANSNPPQTRPYQNYMCYQDGRPFMVINAPSLEHAQFIVAGFTTDHAWMLVALD